MSKNKVLSKCVCPKKGHYASKNVLDKGYSSSVRFVLFSREDKGSCDFLDYGFNNYALRITNSALKKGGPSKVWEALKDV